MCKAFSCIISKNKKVIWKLGVDSHSDLITLGGYKDSDDTTKFVRVEVAPKNKDYLFPDKWELKVDSTTTPDWWSPNHKEVCLKEHKKWKRKLNAILVRKPIVHPFKLKMVSKVTIKQKLLLKKWDSVGGSVRNSVGGSVRNSVGDSVWGSVWDSVWVSVWDSVGFSVWDSVGNSVGGSVWDSVRDSVGGYIGSFFKLKEWKYVKFKYSGDYPFQPVVDLWEQGLVPSFDGTTWRLHSGSKAKVVFEIKASELRKFKA